MADNLTIQIGADTSKLRADLALAQQRVKQFGTEMRAAARQAAATGDRSGVDNLARQLDAATRSAAALKTQLRETNQTIASPVVGNAAKAYKSLTDEIVALGRSNIALGATFLSSANLIGKTVSQLLELQRISQSTGFSPSAIKAVNEALEDTGSEAGSGNRALVGLAKSMAEVRQAARNMGETVGSQVRVLRGDQGKELDEQIRRVQDQLSGVNVGRGGLINKVEVKDASDAFAVLRVDLRKFKDDLQGNDAALQAIIDGFVRLEKTGRTDLGNLAAQALNLGKSMKEVIPALRELGGEGLQKQITELREQGRDPTAQAIAQAKELQKAWKDVGDQIDRVGFTMLKVFGPEVKTQLGLFENDLRALQRAAEDLERAYNAIAYALQRVAAVARDIAFPPAATAAIPPLSNMSDIGFAAGGQVRGRGTSTSDSIRAWLSNGEFVVNAAATSRFLPLLRAINDGMSAPLMPKTHFASGGLVTAEPPGGGTPVHLHIGGGSFPLNGAPAVVSALVVEAHRQHIRSAGVKPSWYGGR